MTVFHTKPLWTQFMHWNMKYVEALSMCVWPLLIVDQQFSVLTLIPRHIPFRVQLLNLTSLLVVIVSHTAASLIGMIIKLKGVEFRCFAWCVFIYPLQLLVAVDRWCRFAIPYKAAALPLRLTLSLPEWYPPHTLTVLCQVIASISSW